MKSFILTLVLLSGTFLNAQNRENAKKAVIPPKAILIAFEKEFTKITPVWSTDYEGEDNDDQNFIADFKVENVNVQCVYNRLGVQQALIEAMPISEIPTKISAHLTKAYNSFKIVEAAKVYRLNKGDTYEIGLQNKSVFYDAIFTKTGDFVEIIQKD